MESCLASCVQRYLRLCGSDGDGLRAPKGKKWKSKKQREREEDDTEIDPSKFLATVPTPFLNESDQRESPQGAPCDDPNHPDAVTCPWCLHRFVNRETPSQCASPGTSTKPSQSADTADASMSTKASRPVDSIGLDASTKAAGPVDGSDCTESESTLNHEAASVLMNILYGARMARYDLLKATNTLACRLTKWDSDCDARLHRLVSYIWSTLDERQVGYVAKGDQSGLHLFTDADLGGCAVTQRSTTGVFLCIRGEKTVFPFVAVSKRQYCVSVSTPEAELVAGSHGLLRELVPALDMCDRVLTADYPAVFHEDNQAMIRVIKYWRNPTMIYLHRTQNIHCSPTRHLHWKG